MILLGEYGVTTYYAHFTTKGLRNDFREFPEVFVESVGGSVRVEGFDIK